MKTLLINSKIWLGENKFTESIGFDSLKGKIDFLGTDYEAKNIKSNYEEVIDLNKKLTIPAFTDGHCHFIKGALVNSQLNLRNAETKNDIINGIKEYRHNNNHITWIYGGYFSESNFKEKVTLNKKFLDEIFDDIPIIVSKFDMHSAFANSKALELSGIANKEDKFTAEELCKIEDDFTGELKEKARDFVMDSIPHVSLNERIKIALNQLSKLYSFGITAVSDITLVEDLEVYKELIKSNKLLLRVDARLPFTEFENLNTYKKDFSSISNIIKFNSLKAFYDGSLSSRTALMHSNYKDSNENGMITEFVKSGEFEKMAFQIDKAGLQMSVHAIGDKAVTELLDLNERLVQRNGFRDRRFRIEHAQHIQENDLKRFKDLNVIASVQPAHLFSDAKTAFEILQDYKLEHNYNKLFNIGAKVCFGTDFPVVNENPFETIYYAMTRNTEGFENGFVPENKISLLNCLNAYTYNNAYATYEENERGNLEIGKYADVAVLENDLFEMNPEDIKNVKVYMTYFNGSRVH